MSTGSCWRLRSWLPTVTSMHHNNRRPNWPTTRVSDRLGLRHPIVQGPFGGGLSSVALTAAVSDAGGLGSFGVHHLDPATIAAVAEEVHAATTGPFALNLWVSNHDLPEAEMTPERFAAAIARLQPLYDELEVEPPAFPDRFAPSFDEQAEAVLRAAPAAFSFVFGVPDARLLDEARERGIVTLGTATTPDEAVALDEAGVEEVLAVDDVGAELGRPFDRDRVDASAAGEVQPVRAVLEPGRDVLEPGPEGADAHVSQLGLEGRMLGVCGKAARERRDDGSHRVAPSSVVVERTASVSCTSAA